MRKYDVRPAEQQGSPGPSWQHIVTRASEVSGVMLTTQDMSASGYTFTDFHCVYTYKDFLSTWTSMITNAFTKKQSGFVLFGYEFPAQVFWWVWHWQRLNLHHLNTFLCYAQSTFLTYQCRKNPYFVIIISAATPTLSSCSILVPLVVVSSPKLRCRPRVTHVYIHPSKLFQFNCTLSHLTQTYVVPVYSLTKFISYIFPKSYHLSGPTLVSKKIYLYNRISLMFIHNFSFPSLFFCVLHMFHHVRKEKYCVCNTG